MDERPKLIKATFMKGEPTKEEWKQFAAVVMSAKDVHDLMVSAMDAALKMLDKLNHQNESEIVTPTLIVGERTVDGPHQLTFCQIMTSDEEAAQAYHNLGKKFRADESFVTGLVHFCEGWVSVRQQMPPESFRPKDDPDRREAIMITGCTMTGGFISMMLPYTRDEERKPVYDKAAIDNMESKRLVIPPKHFLWFLKGYADKPLAE